MSCLMTNVHTMLNFDNLQAGIGRTLGWDVIVVHLSTLLRLCCRSRGVHPPKGNDAYSLYFQDMFESIYEKFPQ